MSLACYICSHVYDGSRPVLLVAREDNEWMFLCGGLHGVEEEYSVVGINHLLDRDRDLVETLHLAENHQCSREDVGSKWVVSPLELE